MSLWLNALKGYLSSFFKKFGEITIIRQSMEEECFIKPVAEGNYLQKIIQNHHQNNELEVSKLKVSRRRQNGWKILKNHAELFNEIQKIILNNIKQFCDGSLRVCCSCFVL